MPGTVPAMRWVDTHCHLQLDERRPDLLLERAVDVDWVVVPGVDLDSSREAALLAAAYPGKVLATAGLHPHEAEKWTDQGDAIAQLAPDYQEVIILRNLQRLPFDEVAHRMERSRPAAQMLWMRAIQKLQEVLGERLKDSRS